MRIICATFISFINEFPITPRTKAGPALTQNDNILSACFLFIIFFSNKSDIPFAPTGNPPIMLNKITERDDSGRLKILETGEIIFPILDDTPELIINDDKNMNGNNDGTNILQQRDTPSFTPLKETSG